MSSACNRGDTAEEGRTPPPSRRLFFPVFLSGDVERKKGKCSERGERPSHFLPLPRKQGVGEWEEKNRAATLFCSPGRTSALPAPGSPGAQRRELESFALGGT